MEPILFVMAILGCGESDAPCREVRLDQARYRSEAQCVAATEETLMRHDDLLFPAVVAQCRPAGARPASLRGTEVMMPEGRPIAPPRYASARLPRSSR